MKSINIIKFLSAIFIFLFLLSYGYSQVNTDSVYKSIMVIKDPLERLKSLREFINEYPELENIEAVRTQIFYAAIETKDSNLAMEAAQELIKNAIDVATIYNRVAFNFAESNMWLDSALVYSTLANQLYEKTYGRKRVPFLDTKALVFYKLGDYEQAYRTQKEALALYPKEREWDPNFVEYYYHLALYMYKYLKNEESLILMARCSFFGMEEATKMLDEIFSNENLPYTKSEIYKKSAEEYFRSTKQLEEARSIVALGWAKQNILMDDAYQLAKLSVEAINENTPVDQIATSYTTFGVINVLKGSYNEGIQNLLEAEKYSSPYNTDLYYHLGLAYEKIGDTINAYKTYLKGVLAFTPELIMERLKVLHQNMYSSGPTLEEVIRTEIEKIESFEVEKFVKPEGLEKVVLAELFTGSECRPCLAADYAYDKLIESFDTNTLGVLEYHLHIPAPDPMTNEDTEARAKFYGVNSTPTSIIEGTQRISAGGNKTIAKSRYEVFSMVIKKYLQKSPEASIKLDVKKIKNKINLSGVVKTTRKDVKDLKFFAVLAEEKVHYKGYNTVSEHRFVVRKILPERNGISFRNKKELNVKASVDLSKLQNELKDYLDNFEKKANRKLFKEKKYAIDENNLYMVSFVQDEETKEILQTNVLKIE